MPEFAKIASLGCILVLAVFAGFGFESSTAESFGLLSVHNSASHNMTMQHVFSYNDGSLQTTQFFFLPQNHTVKYEVISRSTSAIYTEFKMATPGGLYKQAIYDWCSGANCAHTIFWVAADNGFSWANSPNGTATLAAKWRGPFPPSVAVQTSLIS